MNEGLFTTEEEAGLAQQLYDPGWVIEPAESPEDLQRIQQTAARLAAEYRSEDVGPDTSTYLERLGDRLEIDQLNPLRLAVFRGLNERPWLRPACYRLALAALVGNELAMQRRVNLSIQVPGDESSLLPLHADSWSGDSPYEIVLWIPLVDCALTQSMFILPRLAQERLLERQGADAVAKSTSVEGLYRSIESEVTFLEVPFGSVVLFDQNLLHGNRINRETTTRWSLNCRFKGLFTPYADKKLGEFFEPITLRPMSRLGMAHRFPNGFRGGDSGPGDGSADA